MAELFGSLDCAISSRPRSASMAARVRFSTISSAAVKSSAGAAAMTTAARLTEQRAVLAVPENRGRSVSRVLVSQSVSYSLYWYSEAAAVRHSSHSHLRQGRAATAAAVAAVAAVVREPWGRLGGRYAKSVKSVAPRRAPHSKTRRLALKSTFSGPQLPFQFGTGSATRASTRGGNTR